MARSAKRASTRDLDTLHRLTIRGLNSELRRIAKAKEALPAALLSAAAKVLALTGTTEGARVREKEDRLAGLLKDYESEDDGVPPEADCRRPSAKPSVALGRSLAHPLVTPDEAPEDRPSVPEDQTTLSPEQLHDANDATKDESLSYRWTFDRAAQVRLPQVVDANGRPVDLAELAKDKARR